MEHYFTDWALCVGAVALTRCLHYTLISSQWDRK